MCLVPKSVTSAFLIVWLLGYRLPPVVYKTVLTARELLMFNRASKLLLRFEIATKSEFKMSDNKGKQDPKITFSTYMAEADQLFHKGEYSKAVESYSTALLFQPGDRNCLVARSRCYLKIGEAENALKDAEASLKADKSFFKALYQKAEALYTMGDFEFALVFYHRCHKLRPELQEFRLGIQKAEEAITNSLGSSSFVKLENKGDLSLLDKADENKTAQPKSLIHRPKKDLTEKSQKTPKSERTDKQLMGELYADKEYLEKLLSDKDLIKGKTRSGERLQDIITSCISYLDTRTEFWRQQKPISACEKVESQMVESKVESQMELPSL